MMLRVDSFRFISGLTTLAAVYFGGSYLNPHLLILFNLLMAMLVLSVIRYIVSITSLRYVQQFDNDHPQRGDTLNYTLRVENPLPFTISSLTIHFISVHHDELRDGEMAPLHLSLAPGKEFRWTHSLPIPWRGVYKLGLKEISYSLLCGAISVTHSAWHRTFYVLPRLLPVKLTLLSVAQSGHSTEVYHENAANRDGLLRELRDYRRGDPPSHIAWRRMAALGKPLVRCFESHAYAVVHIHVDFRPLPDARRGEAEEAVMETLVSLVKHHLENGWLVRIGEEEGIMRDMSDFVAFHHSTIFTQFDRNEFSLIPPQRSLANGNRVILISAQEDYRLLDLRLYQSAALETILLLHGLSPIAHERLRNESARLPRLHERAAALHLLDSTDESIGVG